MEKPTNLPNMEIIKDNRMGKSGGQGGGGGRGGGMGGMGMGGGMGMPMFGGDNNLFTPGYVKPTVSRVSCELQAESRADCRAVEPIRNWSLAMQGDPFGLTP